MEDKLSHKHSYIWVNAFRVADAEIIELERKDEVGLED